MLSKYIYFFVLKKPKQTKKLSQTINTKTNAKTKPLPESSNEMDNPKFMKWILAQHPNTGRHEDAIYYRHSLFLENTRLQERKWLLKIYPSGYRQPLPRASARMAPEHCNKPPVWLRGPKQLLKHLRHLSQPW